MRSQKQEVLSVLGAEMDLAAIELMLATTHPPFSRPGWIFEFKYDGYRLLADKHQLLTRQKRDATTWFPDVVATLARLRGSFVLDGEVCSLDERGVPNFEAMRGSTSRKGGRPVTYFVFDLLFHNGRDLRRLPLLERKRKLSQLIPKGHPTVRYVDYLETEGERMFEFAVSIGMEGVVGKRADSAYVGMRSRDWLKAKPPGFHKGWKRPLARTELMA